MKNYRFAIVAALAAACNAISSGQWLTNGVKVYYNAGNVGIGTSNPAHRLDVRSAGARAISILNSASNGDSIAVYGKTNSSNGYASYFVGGRNFMQGRLGLGQNNPSQRLDVNGNIRVNGWIGTNVAAPVTLRSGNRDVLRVIWPGGAGSPNIVAGYDGNSIEEGAIGSVISGGGMAGESNDCLSDFNTISGGSGNQTNGSYSTVGGGTGNNAAGNGDTVAGGYFNETSGDTISGSSSAIGGGYQNLTRGNYATIPGGRDNNAEADYSFAAGLQAKALHAGAFVWGDATFDDITSSTENEMTFRSTGGVRIFTDIDLTAGVTLAAGGSAWASVSDRNAKENFEIVDAREVLRRLAGMPVTSWNYKSQPPEQRHMGPTAQDFSAAFGLGEDQRRISTIDADGVLFASVQGLHQLVEEKDAQITSLQQRVEALEKALQQLQSPNSKDSAACAAR